MAPETYSKIVDLAHHRAAHRYRRRHAPQPAAGQRIDTRPNRRMTTALATIERASGDAQLAAFRDKSIDRS